MEGATVTEPRRTRNAHRRGRPTFHCNHENCGQVFHLQANLDLHNHEFDDKVKEAEQNISIKKKSTLKTPKGVQSSSNKKGDNIRRRRSRKKIFECAICLVKCKQNNLLEDHVRIYHTMEKPFSCSICHKCFATKGNVRNHKIYHKAKTISCPKCKFTCKSNPQLKRHNMLKHDKKNHLRYNCPKPGCSAVFVFKTYLRKHLETHQEPLSKLKYYCAECDRRWMSQTGFNSHLNTHHNLDKPTHQCYFCRQMFETEELLLQHQIEKGHNKYKPFNCGYCRESFSLVYNLQRHQRRPTHIRTKQEYEVAINEEEMHQALAERNLALAPIFPCPSCESSYNTEAELDGHKEMVHNKLPKLRPIFQCEEDGCRKIFDREDHLARHVIAVHIPRERFECKKCGRSFKRKFNLDGHKCGQKKGKGKSSGEQLYKKKSTKAVEPTFTQPGPSRISQRVGNRIKKAALEVSE